MASEQRRILAMGGGGFTTGERNAALDRHVLALTGKPIPKICFIPTASGDTRELVLRFEERFGSWPCEPTALSLFHLDESRLDPRGHVLAQDALYVGGGSMRNLLAVWSAHGIEEALRAAWERGAVLAGVSAGAMCWFEGGISRSGGAPAPLSGLGLLSGSLSVHLEGEPERLPAYRQAVASGELPAGYAADDGAGLVFAGTQVEECVGSRAGARVVRVDPDGRGGTVETELPVRLLGATERHWRRLAEAEAISELRELRAGRDRWD